ncbi:xylan 1,4-beta-xylosidase [Friedmanniella endophytica]|uniref:Xylan 1,4-beta-xylosidase n=1 Tax=Microlunatus kandeliicorticis TaxID=1759536 RepID=A0A7W3P4N1_9ACTN|nr:glycoside hydrolase [Microlunatus kandeliicorticis]MBA8793093.1 xylan 1,4-beta-xylosidase [Microlunatus kandeliicorticis]
MTTLDSDHATTTAGPATPATGPAFPPAAPSDPTAPHVTAARVEVRADRPTGPLDRVWESIGYDEINWTYTPTGRRLLRTFGDLADDGFLVRPHYVFCSGSGFGIPHWGSGNVYHEDADGRPRHDFGIVDQAYDAIVGAGHHVLVELGFTPRDLVPDRAAELTVAPSPTVYTSYEAGAWAYPPRDLDRWAGLVRALAAHCRDRYGEQEVSAWLWELWNEPDIFYWRGSVEEFCALYSVTAAAVRAELPEARVGGPAVTSGGADFLRRFLAHTSRTGDPLDFVSYHSKGCAFPSRLYRPADDPPPERLSPSSTKMLHDLRTLDRVIAEFPRYADLPAVVDECDAAVPAHFGRYDNPNYGFQNTEYYPVFQVKLMKKVLDLNATERVRIDRATSWSFYFEGERFFEGTRSFLTAGRIEKPLLNAYRMLARLRGPRLEAGSDAAWSLTELDRDAADGSSMREEVDVLAAGDPAALGVLVWRHTDDQWRTTDDAAAVEVVVSGLTDGRYRLRHERIDAGHSNAHTVWRALGSPQDPTEEQLEAVRARQGLETCEPDRTVEVAGGRLVLPVALPLPAVSLLSLTRV